jgi:hypothetical protein
MPVSVSGHYAVLGAFGAPVSGPKNSVPGSHTADARRTRSCAVGNRFGVAQMRFVLIIWLDMRTARTQIESARSQSNCLRSKAKTSGHLQRPT